MRIYDVAVSLGTICHTARLLHRLHHRHRSYPFDWVFTSPKIVQDILHDDFATFLNPNYYVDSEHAAFAGTSAGHMKYNGNFFAHKDPRTLKDYEYYLRAVERFRELLSSHQRKLFVMMLSPTKTEHPRELVGLGWEQQQEWIQYQGHLLEQEFHQHTRNFSLLFISVFPGHHLPYHTITHHSRCEFLNLYSRSPSYGAKFQDPEFIYEGYSDTEHHPDNYHLSGLFSELYHIRNQVL